LVAALQFEMHRSWGFTQLFRNDRRRDFVAGRIVDAVAGALQAIHSEVWIFFSRGASELAPLARGTRSKPRHAWTGRMVRGRPLFGRKRIDIRGR